MARRAKNVVADATETKRNRRTPEQMIADLEAKIAGVKKRAESKKAKTTSHGKALFVAAKSLDKAIASAESANAHEMLKACNAARALLTEAMITMGVRLPESRPGRPRNTAA